MDPFSNPNNAVAFLVWLLVFILHASDSPLMAAMPSTEEEEDDMLPSMFGIDQGPSSSTAALIQSTADNFRFFASFNVYHDELQYWMKPRSTTWFSRFLLQQYNNTRWVTMFRMTKPAVFALAEVIRPHIEKKNTTYRLAVPVLIRVACTLFKLTHGANFTVCSELFAIGRSTVSKILREVVHAINDSLRQEITFPIGERLRQTQLKFFNLCSLPVVVGALDGMHISISKPRVALADYYYFKSGGYSMSCQAVVDSDKRFLDLYVGMPGSTNDSRILRRSSLYHSATHGTLMNANASFDGFTSYVLADSGYPLLPWVVVPHKDNGHLSIAESLLNKKLRKGRSVVENAFGILKQSFRELLVKSDLHVTFLPDVVVCCAILHNLLLQQSHEEVAEFLQILHNEGLNVEDAADPAGAAQAPAAQEENHATTEGEEKRRQLGVYLSTRRRVDG